MTWPTPPQLPNPPHTAEPTVFPAAQQLTVADSPCGHLPGDAHDSKCDYWRGVAAGEYPHPDAYVVDITHGLLATISQPLVFPASLVDPALRGVA